MKDKILIFIIITLLVGGLLSAAYLANHQQPLKVYSLATGDGRVYKVGVYQNEFYLMRKLPVTEGIIDILTVDKNGRTISSPKKAR